MLAEIDRRLEDGRMTNREAADAAKAYIESLEDGEMRDLSNAMAKLSEMRDHERVTAALEFQMAEPLSDLLGQARASYDAIRKKVSLPGAEEWGARRAVLEPTAMWAWYRQNLGAHHDKILKSVLRYHGVDHRIVDRTEAWECEHMAGSRDAIRSTMQHLLHGDIPTLLKQHGVILDTNNYGHVLRLVDEGWYHMEAYKRGLEFVHEDANYQAAVRERAALRYKQGLEMMEKVFGKGNISTISKFNDALMKILNEKYTLPMFMAERRYGHAMTYRSDYVPVSMRGRWQDVNELIDRGVQLKKDNKSIAGTFNSATIRRSFHNSAELEIFMDMERARRAEKNLPILDVDINRSISTTMAYRKFLHNKTLINSRFLSDLKELLPMELLPFERVSMAEGIKLANRGFLDVGEVIPQMAGWRANERVIEYLKSYTKGGLPSGSELEHFGTTVTGMLMPYARVLKHWNVSLDLNHVKNITALGLIAGVDFGKVIRNIRNAQKAASAQGLHSKKMGRGTFERWASPFSPLADALESHPLYELGVRNGLIPYGGLEVGMPLDMQVDARMGRTPAWKMWFDGKSAPPNRLTFDLIDRAIRLALFEQYLDVGLSPREAAATANHFLLDYSMKWMNPNTRAAGYTMFPFLAWTVGNLKLHIPNMIHNPRWYALMSRFHRTMNQEFSGASDEDQAAVLASMFATPFYRYQPDLKESSPITRSPILTDNPILKPAIGTQPPLGGQQIVVQHALPHQAPMNLMFNVINALGKGDVLGAGEAGIRYAGNRMWFPYRVAMDAMMPGAKARNENKTLVERLVGKDYEPGLIQEHLSWGVGGMTEPAWREIGYPLLSGQFFNQGFRFPRETLANFFIRTRGLSTGMKVVD